MAESKEWAVSLRPNELDQMIGQEVNVEIIKGWIKNKTLPNSIIFYGKSGCGKALVDGTLVLTNNGYAPIQTLYRGDMVAGTDGNFHEVTGIFPQGVKECYDVSFSTGVTITASADHIWTVSFDHGKTFMDLTTSELVDLCTSYRTITLPEIAPLQYSSKDLWIDPYILGVLIAAGSFRDGFLCFTTDDDFIVKMVERILNHEPYEATLRKLPDEPNTYAFCSTDDEDCPLFTRSELEWLGFQLDDKTLPFSIFIHSDYLQNAIGLRRQLLAGILDAAGSITPQHQIWLNLSNISLQVRRQIQYLAETLGIITILSEPTKPDVINFPVLQFFTPALLCSTPQKRTTQMSSFPAPTRYELSITKITPAGEHKCTCISVDAPDHLYLTEHCIPTHNTTTARALAKALDAELVELDAASHSGVDDARQINEQAARLSLTGRQKIFLIDEAHRLSVAAWDAMLKTIEEPNTLTTFIFATTDYSKLPMTIRGRSRMLKFYSVPDEQLKQYAFDIMKQKGYSLKDEVVDLIVQQAKGQVRDLLKLLQTACEGNVNDITKLKKLLAIPDSNGMRTYIAAVLGSSPKAGIAVINGIQTDLLEWVGALRAHIYELLEDKYEIRSLRDKVPVASYPKIQKLTQTFTDKQFGLLLTELLKIQQADTAYAQLYALLFRGV